MAQHHLKEPSWPLSRLTLFGGNQASTSPDWQVLHCTSLHAWERIPSICTRTASGWMPTHRQTGAAQADRC